MISSVVTAAVSPSAVPAAAGTEPVSPGGVPGAVAMAGRGPSVLETVSAGYPADTVFDLASLTKVVATTTVTLALGIDLAAEVCDFVPAPLWSGVTVRHLLTHTSGLPDTRKFYQWCTDRSSLIDSLYSTPLEVPPGTRVTYSDLGFITLGEIVAAVTGEPLNAAVRRLVLEPLGMTSSGFLPLAYFPPSRFAPTTEPDTGLPPPGVVHDENARVLGGVAKPPRPVRHRRRPGPLRPVVGVWFGRRPGTGFRAADGHDVPNRGTPRCGRLPWPARARLGLPGGSL